MLNKIKKSGLVLFISGFTLMALAGCQSGITNRTQIGTNGVPYSKGPTMNPFTKGPKSATETQESAEIQGTKNANLYRVFTKSKIK